MSKSSSDLKGELPITASRERVMPKNAWLHTYRFLFGVSAVCVFLFGFYYLRGAWPADIPSDPKSVSDGVRCQLIRTHKDRTEIRTAVVIPVPLETAWRILSDYEEWERLFKTVRRKQITERVGENQHHVVSDVTTPMGTLTLDFIVTHEHLPGGGYRASWDAPTPELPVNEGEMRITPLSPNETLFVYTVRKEYRKYPSFLVNNMLLNHQPDLVATLATRMQEVAKESSPD